MKIMPVYTNQNPISCKKKTSFGMNMDSKKEERFLLEFLENADLFCKRIKYEQGNLSSTGRAKVAEAIEALLKTADAKSRGIVSKEVLRSEPVNEEDIISAAECV